MKRALRSGRPGSRGGTAHRGTDKANAAVETQFALRCHQSTATLCVVPRIRAGSDRRGVRRSRAEAGGAPDEGSDGSRLQCIQMKVCVGTGAAGPDQTWDGLWWKHADVIGGPCIEIQVRDGRGST